MPASYEDSSTIDRMLYSPQKALDITLDLGATPERLFRVFYPTWRVEVEGSQRTATDFEELEWFMERGLHEGGLTSLNELVRFFGLEERFVRALVEFLRSIGHIKGDNAHLALTELGLESVKARVRYRVQKTSAKLYFDGLGSRPLTRKHYAILFYESLPEYTPFQAVYTFNHQWDENALQRLMTQPDRDKYNLPDEITHIALIDRELVYLPIYIIEIRSDGTQELPRFLVFSRVRGLRDTVLETAVNNEPIAQTSLRGRKRENLERSIESKLDQYGLSADDWHLMSHGPLGYQVVVNAKMIDPTRGYPKENDNRRGLTIYNVGKYLMTNDWCVWLTCDSVEMRKHAAVDQILEWLQRVTADPTAEEIRKRISLMGERFQIEQISADSIFDGAKQQGLARALERLDLLMINDELA